MLKLIYQCRPSALYLQKAWQSTTRGMQKPAPGGSSTNNSGKKLSVMIFGSDEFAAGILKKLNYYVSSNESRIVHIEVACPLPKGGNMSERVGKKWVKNNNFTPIHRTASELSYKVHPRSPQSLSGWAIPEPSLGGRFSGNVETIAIVCYSNLILPERLANSFSLGMLHIHPSLLPMHRGQTAIQTAILRGDESTGVTISEYSFRTICGGKILAQIPYKLNRTSKFSEVQQILAQLGGDLMGMVLENLSYLRAHAILQNESQATYTRQYTDDDMKVVWEKMTANDIYRRYRAFYGLMSLHTVWRKKQKMHKLLLLNMYVPDPDVPLMSMRFSKYAPGAMFFINKVPYLEVPCIDGSRIHLLDLLVVGRTPKTALQFVNGYLRDTGAIRMLTNPVEPKKATPPFEYPAGHPHAKKDPKISQVLIKEGDNHTLA